MHASISPEVEPVASNFVAKIGSIEPFNDAVVVPASLVSALSQSGRIENALRLPTMKVEMYCGAI